MSTIAIEEVGVDSIGAIMAIMNIAFDAGYGEAWTESQTLSMLGLPGVWMSLARLDGVPAGFALNRIIADEAELLLLAVDPASRRRGLAVALIEHTRRTAHLRNGFQLHLEVRHNNPAIELYRKAGFNVVGRRPGYYRGINGEIHDALTLSCSIGSR